MRLHKVLSRVRSGTPLPNDVLDRVHALHPGLRLTFYPQGQHAGRWGLLLREGTWRWREAGLRRTRHYQRFPEAVSPDTWYEIEAQLDGDHVLYIEEDYGWIGSQQWINEMQKIIRHREAWRRKKLAEMEKREPQTREEMLNKYPELAAEIDEECHEWWPLLRGRKIYPMYQRQQGEKTA